MDDAQLVPVVPADDGLVPDVLFIRALDPVRDKTLGNESLEGNS